MKKEGSVAVTKRTYEIPLFDMILIDSSDAIATSGLNVSSTDVEGGYGPLIPIGKK